MRVALLISGYLRTFKVNIPLIKSKILDSFDSVDVYIHITKNEHRDDRYFNISGDHDDLDYINNILNPVCIIQEDNILFSDDKSRNNLLNLWVKYYKLNKLKCVNENINGVYDMVHKIFYEWSHTYCKNIYTMVILPYNYNIEKNIDDIEYVKKHLFIIFTSLVFQRKLL